MSETSCYCDQCLTGEEFKGSSTCDWKTVTVRKLTADLLLFVSTIGLLPTMKMPGTPAGQVQQNNEQPGWRGRGFLHDQRQGKGSGSRSCR